MLNILDSRLTLKIHRNELLFPEKSTLIVGDEKTEYALEKCNDFPASGIGTYKFKRNQAIAIMAMIKCLHFFIFCIFLGTWPIKILLFASTLSWETSIDLLMKTESNYKNGHDKHSLFLDIKTMRKNYNPISDSDPRCEKQFEQQISNPERCGILYYYTKLFTVFWLRDHTPRVAVMLLQCLSGRGRDTWATYMTCLGQ